MNVLLESACPCCKNAEMKALEPIGDPSTRVPCCKWDCGKRRESAAWSAGCWFGIDGSKVHRIVVLSKLRLAPMRDPSSWN